MATTIAEFQQKLLTDEQARKDFAANPAKVLADNGIVLPPNTKVPDHISLDTLNTNVAHIREGLDEQHLKLSQIDPTNTAAVTHFVENAIPLRTKDLIAVQQANLHFNGGGDVATAAVVAVAVVAAVAAVVVAVAGRTGSEFVSQPAAGISGISRLGNTFTLHAPNGVRVEGLDAAAVTQIIRNLNTP